MFAEVHVPRRGQGALLFKTRIVRRGLRSQLQYGLDQLESLAAQDIKSKLMADNIMLELFSTITSLCVSRLFFYV